MSTRSQYYSALQVSRERVRALRDVELGELMFDLLRAHTQRCGSPLSEVRVNAEDKATDSGSDGWTADPGFPDEWFGDTETCWQFKAGTAGEPAKLGNEVLKPEPRRTLEAGGRFVVVASGSTAGKRGEDRRLVVLREAARAAGIPSERIDVIGCSRLATWINLHPAVAARWSGRPAGLWTLSEWARVDTHQVLWQPYGTIVEDVQRLRHDLQFDGSIVHLHITGALGVGKTRFALELCREAPWSSSVVYIPGGSAARPMELIEGAARDAQARVVLVVDDVPSNELASLREAVSTADGRVRLITTGHAGTPDRALIAERTIAPLPDESMRALIRCWSPGLPLEHVEFVVRFSDGYVRLAKLATDAVVREGSLSVAMLFERSEIRRFLDDLLGPGNREALRVVALLSRVGWIDDAAVEGKTVANALGLDWGQVRSAVSDWERRLGVVPERGRYRSITPLPLGNYLAAEAWTASPLACASLDAALPSDAARQAYYERVASISSHRRARRYAQKELARLDLLAQLHDVRSTRRWAAYSSSDPDRAASAMAEALQSQSASVLRELQGENRRELVEHLVRLASRVGSFSDSARGLALLAAAENETWANNATAEFIGLFRAVGSGTAVAYVDRLDVLDGLVRDSDEGTRRLVVQALANVAPLYGIRLVSSPPSDELPSPEWRPESGAEYVECIHAAVSRLVCLAASGEKSLRDELVSAVKDMRGLLRDHRVRDEMETLFVAIRDAFPDQREALRRQIAEVIAVEERQNNAATSALDPLRKFHEQFAGRTLSEKLRQFVGAAPRYGQERPDLQPLARELLASQDVLLEHWEWLLSGEAVAGWLLGEATANEDEEVRLLVWLDASSLVDCDLRFLCGYLHVQSKRFGTAWLDEWLGKRERPESNFLVIEVFWRCGGTSARGELVAQALRAGHVAADVVARLEFGRWDEELDELSFGTVIEAMVAGGYLGTAVAILDHRLEKRPDELDARRKLVLELVLSGELIRRHGMIEFHWERLAERLVERHATEIADAILAEQADRSRGMWFLEFSGATNVLRHCAEVVPSGVWQLIAARLNDPSEAPFFCVGVPPGLIDFIDHNEVLAWLSEDPAQRGAVIARLMQKDFSDDRSTQSRILGAYADIREVAGSFLGEYMSGSWSGPASAHWRQLAAALSEVAGKTKLPKLRVWAIQGARTLEEMAMSDEELEAEEHRFRA